MTAPDLGRFPGIPQDEDGPVFAAPWQAQAFAMAVKLQAQGVFTWEEWADEIGSVIAAALASGDPDLGDTYYDHWLSALERISEKKGLTTTETLARRKELVLEEHRHLHEHDD